MFFISFLLASLTTSLSAPIGPSPVDDGGPSLYHIFGREVPECLTPRQFRTASQIAWSCLTTIFVCTWVAIHPNIGGPTESGFQRLRRQVMTMICVVIAPEMMVVWALRQHLVAQRIVNEFNDKYKLNFKKSFGTKVKDYFTGPTDNPNEGWTLTHGFFVQMGGFIIYDGREPYKVLTWERMLQSIEADEIDVPFIPETDILDKSKGDFLTKLFVVTQTTWFVFQCFARWYARLSLAELEVLTLAFAALNIAIYAIWWNKPQNARYPIRLPLKHPHGAVSRISQADTSLDNSDPPKHERICSGITQDDISIANVAKQGQQGSRDPRDKRQSTLTQKFWEGHNSYDPPANGILPLPVKRAFRTTLRLFMYQGLYFLIELFFRPLRKLGINTGRPQLSGDNSKTDRKADDYVGKTRVPMFHAEDGFDYNKTAVVIAILISVVFGALHLVLWSSPFKSTVDRWLWRGCSLYVTVEPLVLLAGFPAVLPSAPRWLNIVGYTIYIIAATLYGFCRLTLLCLAIYTLFDLPESVYRDINWMDLITARVF